MTPGSSVAGRAGICCAPGTAIDQGAVSAVEGVRARTRVLMRTLRRLGIPTLIFVNELDRGDAHGPVPGTVFKVERGPAGEKIACVRMFSATVRVRDRLPFRSGQEYLLHVNRRVAG